MGNETKNTFNTFKVLISCMNQSDFSIVERSRLSNVPVFIVNQCKTDKTETVKSAKGDHVMIKTPSRGLSVSRNMAISKARADICLISDDDEVFCPDLQEKVLGAYQSYPEADVIIFKMENRKSRLGEKAKKLKRLDCLKVASWQISFKSASVKNKILFDEKMGAGTNNGASEENKFLLDCYDAGLKIYYVPIEIASVAQEQSTWFAGHDGKFFFDRGKATRRMLGAFTAFFYALYYLVFKYFEYREEISFFSAAKNLFSGLFANDIDAEYKGGKRKNLSGTLNSSLACDSEGVSENGEKINRIQALSASVYAGVLILIILLLGNKITFDFYVEISLFTNFAFLTIGLLLGNDFNKKFLFFIAIATFYFLISALITGGGMGSVATFLVSLAMPAAYTAMAFSKWQKRMLSVVCSFGVVALFVFSIFYNENWDNWSTTHTNTNTLGYFVMFLFIIVCIITDLKSKKLLKNLAIAVLFALSFWAMFNYKSRGTTVVLLVFAVMVNLPAKIYEKKRIFIIAVLFTLFVAVFPFIYLYLYENGYSLTVFGKPLFTGRQELWLNMIDNFKQNPLALIIGLGSKTDIGGSYLNVHNGVLSAVVCFGVLGFAFYYGYMLYKIWGLSDWVSDSTVKRGLIAFVCAVLLLGFSENSSFWTVSYPFAYFGLALASSKKNLIEKNKKSALRA